jgi:post-segregation antitoxin (ccd killing protein)
MLARVARLSRAAAPTQLARRALCAAASAPPPPSGTPERWPFAEAADRRAELDAAIDNLRIDGELFAKARVEGVQIAGALHFALRNPWAFITSSAYRDQAREVGAEDSTFLLRTLEELTAGVDDVYIQLAHDWASGEARLSELEAAGALEAPIAATLRASRAQFGALGLVPAVQVDAISAELLCLDSDTTWSRTTASILVRTTERFATAPLAKPAENADAADPDADAHRRAASAAAAAPAVERMALLTLTGQWHSFAHYFRWVRAQRRKANFAEAVAGGEEPAPLEADELALHPIKWSLRDVNLLVLQPTIEPKAEPTDSS